MRALIVIAIAFGLIAAHGEARSQETCDGSLLTATGRIEEVTSSQSNEYFIDTTTQECGEVSIRGRGRPPRSCVTGAMVSATGVLEATLVGFFLENVTSISCY